MTKLEQVARALAVYQFGNDESWEDQIPMARVMVEALREPSKYMVQAAGDGISRRRIWAAMIDAILSEKPE